MGKKENLEKEKKIMRKKSVSKGANYRGMIPYIQGLGRPKYLILKSEKGEETRVGLGKDYSFDFNPDWEVEIIEVRGEFDELILDEKIESLGIDDENIIEFDADKIISSRTKRFQRIDRKKRMRAQAGQLAESFFTGIKNIDDDNFVPFRVTGKDLTEKINEQIKTKLEKRGKFSKRIVLPVSEWKEIKAQHNGGKEVPIEEVDQRLFGLDKQDSNGGGVLSALEKGGRSSEEGDDDSEPDTDESIDGMVSGESNDSPERDNVISTLEELLQGDLDDEEDIQSKIKGALSLYLAKYLISNDENFTGNIDNRLQASDLNSNLKKAKFPTAPSDSTALFDNKVVRVAFPNLWSSLFEHYTYDWLMEYYSERWDEFKDDRAWWMPEEITADAQIEDILEIADEFGIESNVIEKLNGMGHLVTESEYIKFSPIHREKINQAIEYYMYLEEGHTTNTILSDIFMETIGPSLQIPGLYYHLPGTPASSPLVKYGSTTYIQLAAKNPDLAEKQHEAVDPFRRTRTKSGDKYYWVSFPGNNQQLCLEPDLYLVKLSTFKSWQHEQVGLAVSEARASIDEIESEMDVMGPAKSSLEALAQFLAANSEKMPFDIFTPRSVNFGLMLDYKQIWIPMAYQVGDLIKTIPLAPGETRKYSKKVVVKKDRRQKELESSLKMIGDDSQDTRRVESEIVNKAHKDTRFASHAEATGTVGVVSFTGTTDQVANAAKDSAKTKKNLRESVRKASQSYKQDRKMEVETFESTTTEESSSGEISNPNNEITVTYLFYELQRRFFVTEVLGGIQNIVLVAAPVPTPSKITESFLIQHDWILKRAILDDSYLEAFEVIKDTQVSRETEVGVRKQSVNRQLEALAETKEQLRTLSKLRQHSLKEIDQAVDRLADTAIGTGIADSAMSLLTGGLAGLFGGADDGIGEGLTEASKLQEEAAQEALDRIDKEMSRLRTRYETNTSALEQAITEYARVVRETLRREQSVMRLRVHIAQNILHYMHAIWEYQILDQRYFELYNIQVPEIIGTVQVNEIPSNRGSDDEVEVEVTSDLSVTPKYSVPLHEIADLDNLLGFKGNYMIFPMKGTNPLLDFLAQPYLEEMVSEGELNNILASTGVISEQAEQFVEEVAGGENLANELSWQVVTVPSGLEYIEALPGHHPVLEDFKLKHRHVDVLSALADVKNKDIESFRRLLRLLDGDYSDPDPVENALQIIKSED